MQRTLKQIVMREYFTASGIAIATALIGMAGQDDVLGGNLWVVGLVAAALSAMMYFQTRPRPGESEDESNVPVSRMKKMVLIWYILTIVLAGSFLREVFVAEDVSAIQWILSGVGLALIGTALIRSISFTRKLTRRIP